MPRNMRYYDNVPGLFDDKALTPVQAEILLYHYYCADPFKALSPAHDDGISYLKDLYLIEPTQSGRVRITTRGRHHVEAMLSLPLPVQIWITPERSMPTGSGGKEHD